MNQNKIDVHCRKNDIFNLSLSFAEYKSVQITINGNADYARQNPAGIAFSPQVILLRELER